MIQTYSPVTQQAVTHIVARAYDNDEDVKAYEVSLLTGEQALYFIDGTNYNKKACVSLNTIFVPYATYDTDYMFPSGNNALPSLSGIYNHLNSGVCYTNHKTEIDSDKIYAGNTRDNKLESSWDNKHQHQRNIGINNNVNFVGYSPVYSDKSKNYVASPLPMFWDLKQYGGPGWRADVGFVMGYITNNTVSAPSSPGSYTEFNINTSGIAGRYVDYTCRNYDMRYTSSSSRRSFVVAVVQSIQQNSEYKSFYVPLYIGCDT